MIKWVDDRVFFPIPTSALSNLDADRARLHKQIMDNRARHHDRGRWWYHTGHLPNGRTMEMMEHDEDMHFLSKDLFRASPRSEQEVQCAYLLRLEPFMGYWILIGNWHP